MSENLFPIGGRMGSTRYGLTREKTGGLRLTAQDKDGLKVSITFPSSMVAELVHGVVRRKLRLEADTALAKMFGRPVPAWPADIFEDPDE